MKKNGPAIELLFHAQKGKILSIDLGTSPSGFTWTAPQADTALKNQIETWLKNYFQGEILKNTLPLMLEGIPPFTKSVLEQMQAIPFGQTLSYQELAQRVGNPRAARAVGQACGRNPFPVIIPCHRVLAAHKKLGGFSSGLAAKECLLDFEGSLWF